MARFTRMIPAPEVKGPYGVFRPFVRADFHCCCAYCLLHEDWARGKDNFDLDHFRPQGREEFRHLIREFYNMYYSCKVCNGKKRNHWPTDNEIAQGICFVDLCQDEWDKHYELLSDGSLHPLTKSAAYTIEKIRLNDDHLNRLRKWALGENRRLDRERT